MKWGRSRCGVLKFLFLYLQAPLKLPFQIRWKCGPDMPFGIDSPIQTVKLQHTVYVGGGSVSTEKNKYVVMTYDIVSGKWDMLPPYRTRLFAMVVINNELVLVGRKVRNGDASKELGLWRAGSEKWAHPYPDMSTPRAWCSAVAYKQWLVVAGGDTGLGMLPLSTEVMNGDTKQWYCGPSIPVGWSGMKVAVVGDNAYFMGGIAGGDKFHNSYSASLPDLLSQPDSAKKDGQVWKEICQVPVKFASPVSINGSLLAVGGATEEDEALSVLYLYQPDAGQWLKIADLPARRYDCTCVMIADRELLVAGGWNNGRLASVDIACVE